MAYMLFTVLVVHVEVQTQLSNSLKSSTVEVYEIESLKKDRENSFHKNFKQPAIVTTNSDLT